MVHFHHGIVSIEVDQCHRPLIKLTFLYFFHAQQFNMAMP